MKRILAFLIILVTVFSLSAAPSAGRIGIQIDQMVHLSNDKHPVEAQEIVLSIAGANYFGESRIFGIGYTAGYGFAFDGLTSFNPIHLNASALVRFSLSDWAAVEPRIGLDDTIYIFNDIVSNEFGFSVGCNIELTPVDFIGLNIGVDYKIPIVSSYGNSSSTVAFEKSALSFGLALSYLY